MVDERYSYFSYKNIDWKAVYNQYRPKVQEGMRDEDLFNVMADMLYELRDGHVNLSSNFNVSRNWDWYLDYPQNFNQTVLERSYLGRDYQIAGPFRTTVIDSVGYIYYGSFMYDIPSDVIDGLIERYSGMRGIIIDIRNNGGGSIAYVDTLASRFTDKRTLVGYTKYKNGPGHENFTQPFAKNLEPKGKKQFTKPVVVLTNRSVYSAANEFASFMAHLPNVTLIGDVTGGGGGAPFSGELANGWRVRFSSTQMLTAGMEHIEHGVQPDIKIDMDPADEAQGKDTILDTALGFFRR
jgi:hypothetical protein